MLESFFKVSSRQHATLSKKEAPASSPFWICLSSLTHVFPSEFCELFLHIFCTKHFWATGSEQVLFK